MAKVGARPDWIEDPPAINFQAMNRRLVRMAEGMVEVLDRLMFSRLVARTSRAFM